MGHAEHVRIEVLVFDGCPPADDAIRLGGADVLVGRHWSIGVIAGYNWMADFPQTIGTRTNYSGVDVGIGIGWIWGKGYAQ